MLFDIRVFPYGGNGIISYLKKAKSAKKAD